MSKIFNVSADCKAECWPIMRRVFRESIGLVRNRSNGNGENIAWRGNAYHERREKQLWDYLDYYHLKKGYMLSFNFNLPFRNCVPR